MRVPCILSLSGAFCISSLICAAQLPPPQPLFPKSAQDCANFAKGVEAYADNVSKTHQECLDTHKVDRNVPPDNAKSPSPICSRSVCQSLHDWLYDQYNSISVVNVRNEVPRCYAELNQYLAEKSRQEREKTKREADSAEQARAEKEKQKREAEEMARRNDKHATQQPGLDTRTGLNNGHDTGGSNIHERRPTDGTSASGPASTKDSAKAEAEDALAEPDRLKPSQFGDVHEAIAALNEPLSRANQERSAMAQANALLHRSDDQEKEKMALTAFDHSIKSGEEAVDHTIEMARTQFDKSQMSRKAFEQFKQDAQDTKSVLSGVGHVVRGVEYGALVKELYEADTAGDKGRVKYIEEKMALEVSKDTVWQWSKQAAEHGVTKVVVQLFPKTAPYVSRAITAASGFTSTFFYSSDLVTEHNQIIFDHSGQYSLEDKQAALFQRWKLYDRNPTAWYPDDLKVLINETDAVYKEALRGSSGSGSGRVE